MGQGIGLLVDYAHTTAADQLFNSVDEQAVRAYCDVVGLEDSAKFTGLLEIEQEPALTGCGEEDCLEFYEQRGVGMMQWHFDT